MKTTKATFWFSLLFFIVACSKDDPKSTVENGVIDAVSKGAWRITYFYDSDTDKTSNFTDYAFTFNSGNVVTAAKGITTQTGVWSISDSNSSDDTLEDLHFNIEFTTPAEFEELSDDWDIMEYTSTKIKLIDVSGGGGGTDYLTFEKN